MADRVRHGQPESPAMTAASWHVLAVILLGSPAAVGAQAPTGSVPLADTALAAPLILSDIFRAPQRRPLSEARTISLVGTSRSRDRTTCPIRVHVPIEDDAVAIPTVTPRLGSIAAMPTMTGTCGNPLEQARPRILLDSIPDAQRRP